MLFVCCFSCCVCGCLSLFVVSFAGFCVVFFVVFYLCVCAFVYDDYLCMFCWLLLFLLCFFGDFCVFFRFPTLGLLFAASACNKSRPSMSSLGAPPGSAAPVLHRNWRRVGPNLPRAPHHFTKKLKTATQTHKRDM